MIKVENLTFQYSGSKAIALDNVNLTIPSEQYVAIVGHNGSGKSTLSKILVGLFKPNKGRVIIDDVVLSKESLVKIRSKIGIVFQNPENQFVGASVEDDIAFGLENKKIPRSKMREIVFKFARKVKMENFLNHEPQSLSGGQKQRVAIASTLALDPKIVIFDEITSMLDPKGKREVLEIIKDMKKSKKTLISITHNMDEAILADKIIVLSKGKVIAAGKPQFILNNKEITKLAKIKAPFIYHVSEELQNDKIKPTYSKKELIGAICK